MIKEFPAMRERMEARITLVLSAVAVGLLLVLLVWPTFRASPGEVAPEITPAHTPRADIRADTCTGLLDTDFVSFVSGPQQGVWESLNCDEYFADLGREIERK